MTAENTNKKFRMVALDLDGTLLNSNHALSDATIAHLRQLHAKGFIVSIATGRSAACTAHIIEKLDLSSSDPSSSAVVDSDDSLGFPLVCTNGARGLRIRKSHSDVGHCSNAENKSLHRSNTVPLDANSSKKNTNKPTNPFLKQSLVINEELFHNPLSPSLTLKTLALAHRLGCVTNYYHNHHIYAVVRNKEHLDLTKRYGNLDLYRYLNEKEEDESNAAALYTEENSYGYQKAIELGPPSKLLILCDTSKGDEITALVRAELNGTKDTPNDDATSAATHQQANVIRGTPPYFIEILNPAVNKGQGLRQLCQSLSVPLEEVIAFGDGDNDLEFIQMAGWGVAMKNARDGVKEKADEVAKWSNDEDGVIKTLQLYELQGKLHFP